MGLENQPTLLKHNLDKTNLPVAGSEGMVSRVYMQPKSQQKSSETRQQPLH